MSVEEFKDLFNFIADYVGQSDDHFLGTLIFVFIVGTIVVKLIKAVLGGIAKIIKSVRKEKVYFVDDSYDKMNKQLDDEI